jgi:hypothetical protein
MELEVKLNFNYCKAITLEEEGGGILKRGFTAAGTSIIHSTGRTKRFTTAGEASRFKLNQIPLQY